MMGMLLLAGAFFGGVLLMMFIMYVLNGGITWTVLTASLMNKHLVLSQTRDGENWELEKVDDSSAGMYSTDDVDYIVTEGSTASLKGIPLMISSESAGIGIPLKMAAYTQWLNQQYDIHDLDELKNAIMLEAVRQEAFEDDVLQEAKDSAAYDVSNKNPEEVELEDVDFSEIDIGLDAVDTDKLEGFNMETPVLGESGRPAVTFKDFRRFMKQNVNPALIRAKMEKRIAELRERYQGFHLDASTGMSLFMIILGIAITLFVLFNYA